MPRDALGARVILEFRHIVQAGMVEFRAYLAERPFQYAKIDEHAARIEFVPARVRENPVIVPMQALALPVKIRQKMGRREVGLHSCFKHAPKIPNPIPRGKAPHPNQKVDTWTPVKKAE